MRRLNQPTNNNSPPSLRHITMVVLATGGLILFIRIATKVAYPLGLLDDTSPGLMVAFFAVLDVLVLFIALGLFYGLYRYVIAPLVVLTTYVQELEQGNATLFDTPAVREIATLADAIQRTHNQLVAQMHEIEAYRHIVEHLPLGILRLDGNGRIISANATLFALLEMDPKTWLSGRPLADFWHDAAEFQTWWQSVKTTTSPTTFHPLTWRRANGTPLYVRLDVQPVFDAQGTRVEYICTVTDITAILEAEERLRAAEYRYRTLLESASEGICSVDAEGRICYANTALANLLGIPREALFGRSWQTLCFEEDIPRAYQLWQNAPNAAEFRLHRADGTARWVFVSVAELPPLSGYEERWIVLVTDMQAQKEAQEKLQQSEAYFRTLVQHSRDSVLVLDEQLRVRFMSEAGFRFSGYTPEEVLGQPVENMLVPEDRAHVRERLQEALHTSGRSVSTVVRYRRRDGTIRTLACVATNLLDNPVVQGIVINAHDIHEYVLMQEALERSLQQATSDRRFDDHFFALAAEFLKPLRRMDENVEALLGDETLSPAHHAALKDVQQVTLKLQTLVQKMVHAALIVTQETPFTAVDLNTLMHTVLDTLAPLIQSHQATLIVDELPYVYGNAVQLTLLFQSLLEYSIRHSHTQSPVVRVSAEYQEDVWKIAIHHNGHTIAPESLSYLFSLLPPDASEHAPGTHLGFVSCRYIVEQHGGRIWAHTQPNRGTTFYVTLPPVSSSQVHEAKHQSGTGII